MMYEIKTPETAKRVTRPAHDNYKKGVPHWR